MAELFLARVDGIGGFTRLFAVKRILAHHAANARFVRMFLNEARLAATLSHPNIAQVHDIGVDGHDTFFAMEHVHGKDVRKIMRRVRGQGLGLGHALHVAIGVCAGLHHAHEARDAAGESLGIVHRDVSPSNILVSYEGAVKLVDFGVAKAGSITSETNEGAIKGKYGYMSPEQCLGADVDRRSDVFAIGILLWEMTIGRRLYKQDSELAMLQRIVYADAVRPSRLRPDYPPELEAIVMRALSRNVEHRYQTAQELQVDLEQFALDHQIAVSASATGAEMARLFDDDLEAWREAQEAGRSLADHLVEAAPDPMLASDDPDSDLDVLIRGIHAEGFAPEAAATRPESPVARVTARLASARTSSLMPVAVPARVSSPMPIVGSTAPARHAGRALPIALGAVAGVMIVVGLWFAFLQGPDLPVAVPAPSARVSLPAAGAAAASAGPAMTATSADAVTGAARDEPTAGAVQPRTRDVPADRRDDRREVRRRRHRGRTHAAPAPAPSAEGSTEAIDVPAANAPAAEEAANRGPIMPAGWAASANGSANSP